MKTALVFVTLLSCIFSKYESQLNEGDITVTAKGINYPDKCTAFPKNTTFDIVYDDTEGVKGETTIKLVSIEGTEKDTVEAKCDFTTSKGNCVTQAEVPSSVEKFRIDPNIIEFNSGEKKVTVDITKVNDSPKKYNKNYVPLSSSVKTYQNFSFDVNNTAALAADKGIKIDFEKELSQKLKVYYKGKDDKKTELEGCDLTENKKTIQCPVNRTIFPLNSTDNKTEMKYPLYVENACNDLYDKEITVGVKWGSSHYVKALGLLSLLLVFIL